MSADRFRLTAPIPLEREIHASCAKALDRLLLPPAIWFTYPAGAVQLSPGETAHLVSVGLKRGLPDIFVVFEGFVYGIELKRPGGRLSTTQVRYTKRGNRRVYLGQEDVFPKLARAGIALAVCHSVEHVLKQLALWGVPLRNWRFN